MTKKEYRKKYYQDHREEIIKKVKVYQIKHEKHIKAQKRQNRQLNRSKIATRSSEYYLQNREKIKQRIYEYQHKIRSEAIIAYGPRCPCGETRETALTIDHIDQNGAQHRKEIGHGGTKFYRWLRRNGYPSGFRVLCWNCNLLAYLETKDESKMSQSWDAKWFRKDHLITKQKLVALLGGECVICGKTDLRILTIHHKNHDGATIRREVSRSTRIIRRSILKSGDLSGLECRCLSCNCMDH
jgi:hypothetical protein